MKNLLKLNNTRNSNGVDYAEIGNFSKMPIYPLIYYQRKLVVTCCVLIVVASMAVIVGPHLQADAFSDNAYYLVVAKSLSQGTGLRVISNPQHPLATIAPPGYPFLLSGMVRIVGLDSTFPYRLLSFVFLIFTVLLVGVLIAREDGHIWGYFLGFLTAVNVNIMEFGREILTEPIYMFFSVIAIILIHKYVDGDYRRKWILLVGIIFTLSFLLHLRMVALSLVAATALYFFIRRQVRIGLLIVVIVGLSYLPWMILWSQYIPPLTEWFNTNDPFNLDAETEPAILVAGERLLTNGFYYTLVASRNVLGWSYFDKISNPYFYVLLGLFVVISIAIGLWKKLTDSNRSLIPLYNIFYVAILLVLVSRGIDRYLIPITPFLIWYFFIGVAIIISIIGKQFRVGVPRLRLMFFGICTGVVSSILLSSLLFSLTELANLVVEPPKEELAKKSYLHAGDWLRDNTPPEAIIVARKQDSLYLRSDRYTLRYPYTTDQELITSFLIDHDVSYVVLDGLSYPSREQFLVPYLTDNIAFFEEVYSTPDELTVIYQFRPELVMQ